MKNFGLFALGLTACGVPSTEYALMGEVKETAFPNGHVGCEWVDHNLKAHPPLTGQLSFSSPNCHVDKDSKPQFGHTTEFELDTNNFLRARRIPHDPKVNKINSFSKPLLGIYRLEGKEPVEFLQKFFDGKSSKDCELAQNPSGRWQIGIPKTVLETKGWSFPYFNQTCPIALGPYIIKEESCLSDYHFPISYYGKFGGQECAKPVDENTRFNAFRISGDYVFAYRQGELESHPENIRFAAPYSMKYIQ